MDPQAELVLEAVRFGYAPGGWTLEIPSLVLGREALCGIIGPNGAGKSTLLKLAAGLIAPDAGRIRMNGRELARMRRKILARHLGFLPQECPALFDYAVEQVVAMGRHAHGGVLELEAPGDIAAVSRALDAVRMEPFRPRRLSQLSGGERRRVWLASALAQEPDMLLLDEPTQALDLHHAAAVMEVLSGKAAEGLRVVAVMHDLNLAALFCDRLILMQDGEIVADGTPAEVLTPSLLRAVYGRHLNVVQVPGLIPPVVLPER
ncbi:MAG: ABC transporter ATP-binding protein [Lentisphaerae bacterium]|nr:ABC transporter ATP-binding protein [Lentisphaerota bacterium]